VRLSALNALAVLVSLVMGAVGADTGCDACRLIDGLRLRQAAAAASNEQDLGRLHGRQATALRAVRHESCPLSDQAALRPARPHSAEVLAVELHEVLGLVELPEVLAAHGSAVERPGLPGPAALPALRPGGGAGRARRRGPSRCCPRPGPARSALAVELPEVLAALGAARSRPGRAQPRGPRRFALCGALTDIRSF